MADQAPFDVRARVSAATDLMEQVQRLLDDPGVLAAAPVVLAGAALEKALRGLSIQHTAPVDRPGLSSYAQAPKKAGVLSAAETKDVIAWAGQRNEAAHGEFGDLSRPRAQIMGDGTNLFLQRRSTVTTL